MACFTKCQPFHITTPTAEETKVTTEPHRLKVKLQFSLPGKLHALVAYGKKKKFSNTYQQKDRIRGNNLRNPVPLKIWFVTGERNTR